MVYDPKTNNGKGDSLINNIQSSVTAYFMWWSTIGSAPLMGNICPIAQVVEVEGMLIVRLDKPINVVYNENVFGVGIAEKKIKWQVEKREYNAKLTSCSFVLIRLLDDQLILNNWCDTYLVVDPRTGRVLKESYSK